MGFKDRFKKIFGQGREDEKTASSDEVVFEDSEIELSSFGNVLFVCGTNTDRSPMAEAIFNHKSKVLKAFSAGLFAQTGGEASQNAVEVCANHGIDLSSHKTRNIRDFPVEDMDLVLALTVPIMDALKSEYPDLRIVTLKEHAGDYSDLDIADPVGGGLQGYEECFLEIEKAISTAFDIDVEDNDEPEPVFDVEDNDDSAPVVDEIGNNSTDLSEGRLIVVSGLEGNLEYYKRYLSLWDENGPNCHIVFLGNLIYSMEDDDGSVEILDDAIGKSKNHDNFHYLLGINELSCIEDEDIYKMGINLKDKFHDLVLRKKGSLEPYLTQYIDFFKGLPCFIKTENGLFLSYSGPSKSFDFLDLDSIHDFLWARQGFGGYEDNDVCEFLDGLGLKFMVVGNRPCDEGYDVFSRQLIISSCPLGEKESYLDVDLSEDIDSMDNLVRCLKFIGGVVKAADYPIAFDDEVPFDEGVVEPLKINNFKDLDDIIHSGVREIVLDSDIVLEKSEEDEYSGHGIDIDVHELVIDGRGHTIDARGKTPIFRVSEDANLTIKNIALTNGFAEEGAAIYNNGKLTVIESVFENNKIHIEIDEESYYILEGLDDNLDRVNYFSDGNGGAIYNMGNLTVVKSTFINNFAWFGGAIYNGSKLTVIESIFENNNSYDKVKGVDDEFITLGIGGAISSRLSDSVTNISQSTFVNNFAMDSGAIYNGGELTVSDSIFKKNASEEYGGAIMNDGILNMYDCEVSCNKSPLEIVGINKYTQIYNSVFKDNNSQSIINNHGSKATFGIFYSKFIENEVKSAIISNNGRYGVMDSVTFQSNLLMDNSRNIVNGNELTLIGRMMVEEKSILNEGYLLIKKSSQNFDDIIEGEGEVVIYENMIPTEDRFDFGHLDKKIHESASKEIVLDHDITFENYEREFYEGGVDLDIDGLVIDGNGKTIDARGRSRIFIITGSNITLKNIVFKNGYFYENIMYQLEVGGGALKITQNRNLTIENCKFINNVSEDICGAIDNAGNVTVIESEFDDNNARGCAGAIYNWGGMNIIKSSLQNNAAGNRGSVVYNKGTLDIIESSLQNNVADGHGGAVYNVGELKFLESSFANNKSKRMGGVVYNEGMMDIIESSLQNNVADNRGGVVYNVGELKFLESSFANNKSKRRGGVVYNKGALDIKDSELINNNAHLYGGSIYNEDNVTVSGTVFKGNLSRYRGGALYNDGESDIFKSVFESNSSERRGGALYNDGESVISESVFESNSSAVGGALYNDGESVISESVFESNSSGVDGGGLFNKGNLTVSGSAFKSNVSGSDGGALFNMGKSDVNDVKFIENLSKENGGALYNSNDLSIDNSEFIQNASKISGGAISSMNNELSITNSNFNENNTEKWGGAIFSLMGHLDIINSKFNGNATHVEGGAIYNAGAALSMKETVFIENSSKESAGAIFNKKGEVDMTDCEIRGNNARVDAGAIVNTSELKISKSSIIDNETRGIAGAIVNTANMDISESEISHNCAMHIAGAIDNINGDLTVSESVFKANEVKWDGGVKVSETVFEGGKWNGSGVIYNDDGKLSVSGSTFADNVILGRESKAIWSNNLDFEVVECYFENNQLEEIEFDDAVDVEFEEDEYDEVILGDEDDFTEDSDFDDVGSEEGEYEDVLVGDEEVSPEDNDFDEEPEADTGADEFEEDIDDGSPTGFRYLDNLIHSGSKEIVLDCDIILTDGQVSKYSDGIALDVDDLIIDGNGYTIDARGKSRIFDCRAENVTIKDIVLTNGSAEEGGAIRNSGVLTVSGSTLNENTAGERGGAICNDDGKLTVIESEFKNNSAGYGGAIKNLQGTFISKSSILIANNATSSGGAISNNDISQIEETAINQNTANRGGGISNEGKMTIKSSVLQKNRAEYYYGGAIDNGDELTVIDCEIKGNFAECDGGAIHNNCADLSLIGSSFSANRANERGDAIFNYRERSFKVENCDLDFWDIVKYNEYDGD